MVCRNCSFWNDDRAKFCCHCGEELNDDTMVSVPIADTVTAYSAPTSGIRFFQNIGNGFLQSAVENVRRSELPHESGYRNYTTHATVRPMKNGDWICPDCGEKNVHTEINCRGCGRYR